MTEDKINNENKICIFGNFNELTKVRDFIRNNALTFGFEDDIAFRISLAVDEACTNLIRYAYNSDNSRKICIKLEFYPDKFVISIFDDGIPFNPLKIPSLDVNEYLKQLKRGGLGIHIIRSVMDKIEYYPLTEKISYNTLKLIKLNSFTN